MRPGCQMTIDPTVSEEFEGKGRNFKLENDRSDRKLESSCRLGSDIHHSLAGVHQCFWTINAAKHQKPREFGNLGEKS